ncbi:MAG: 23S rRNA (pseudouridine(1915)-N(3))-methyltransferase RlmH, partial [Rhizobiaceae bacterium]
MRVAVHAVGRMKAGPERDLARRYFDRFGKAGGAVGLDFSGVTETPEGRASDAASRKVEEAGKVLAHAEAGTMLVLLDERGKSLSSEDFAARIGRYRDDGIKTVLFSIGGPDGHDARLRGKADLVLSFGAATWPHQLVRVMLAEQLYRAATILAGHPYHRG